MNRYLLDPPGIGLNAECAHLDGEQYSLKAQAMSVIRFIEDQNLSQAILVGHSFGTIVATNAYDMQPDSNPVKGVILLDPSPPFSGLIEQASNLVLQGSCEVTTKKNSKTIGSSFGAGSLIRTVTKEFPQDAPIENGEKVDMTVQADHTNMKVACGTIKKMNTYVSVAEINRLSKKLTPENAAIIYGQSQQSYGVHELDRGVSENDQVIKASFRRGEHFIHFPYTWNAGEQKGELGERDRCVTIVRVFLEEKFDGK